jgi:hypothetical protein
MQPAHVHLTRFIMISDALEIVRWVEAELPPPHERLDRVPRRPLHVNAGRFVDEDDVFGLPEDQIVTGRSP